MMTLCDGPANRLHTRGSNNLLKRVLKLFCVVFVKQYRHDLFRNQLLFPEKEFVNDCGSVLLIASGRFADNRVVLMIPVGLGCRRGFTVQTAVNEQL